MNFPGLRWEQAVAIAAVLLAAILPVVVLCRWFAQRFLGSDFDAKPVVAARRFSPTTREAIVKDYYAALIESPEKYRTHAQSAYTIAAAIAAGVVAAGALTGIDDAPWSVQLPAVATVVAWLLTAYYYLRAVAIHPRAARNPRPEMRAEKGEDIVAILTYHLKLRTLIAVRLGWAGNMTLIAIGLTALTLALGLHAAHADVSSPRVVALNQDGADVAQELCPGLSGPLRGDADATLDGDWIVVNHVKDCGDGTVRVRVDSVVGVRDK